MPTAVQTRSATRTLQGIEVPAESVNPGAFFALTRRHTQVEKSLVYAGLGAGDSIELKKSDILGGLHVFFSGSLVVTTPTGAVNSTLRWPYDLVKAFRFTANGQSNLLNASGLKFKAREQMANTEITDRGIAQQVSGVSINQGTLSTSAETWGVGTGATAIPAGTYPVELYWYLPVAEDPKDLAGAIFLQTSSMDVTLNIDYETAANLFPTSGTATVALTGTVTVQSENAFVVPDLSLFHSMIQSRYTSLSQGDNEIRLIGQGAGKQLLRIFYQTWNGAAPQTPLSGTAANYGHQAWRYGSNETPEDFLDGRRLRTILERQYNCDVANVWGFLAQEFAATNAFRDTVDMGQTSELRLLSNLQVALTNPGLEYVQETMFAAGAAA
jgi:hypothetical protein